MELELKHLAPYLPYGLNIKSLDGYNYEMSAAQLNTYSSNQGGKNIFNYTFKTVGDKPMLRQLSDLTKEIDFGTHKVIPMQEFYIMFGAGCGSKKEFEKGYYSNIIFSSYKNLSYETISKLFEWHFDVFGLIEKGLAIDINTI